MSIFDLSGKRTAEFKAKLDSLSDEELKRLAEENANDSDAFFQEFVGIRSKKMVVKTAAYQLLREREYKRRNK